MKPTTSSYPASCAIAATIENTLKRTTTYLECGTHTDCKIYEKLYVH